MDRIVLTEFQGYIKGIEKPAEMLPLMWETYGTEMLSHLDGLFCFVMTNKDTDEIFAARDRLGSRTLYYTDSAACGFVCGNSLIDVIKRSGLERKINKDAVTSYLRYTFPHGRQTLFDGVMRLDSGSYLWRHDGKTEIVRYYQPVLRSHSEISLQEWADRIHTVVEEVCHEEQCKDCLLSSGVDSAYLSAMLPAKETYTITFKEGNESNGAADIAKFLGIQNNQISISCDEFMSRVEEAIAAREMPVEDPSYIALYIGLSKLKGCKTVCSGEGVDELMLGYNHFEPFIKDEQGLLSRQLFDCLEGLGDNLLPSLQATSKAFGIDFRFPFLDSRFVDLSMEIPSDCKLTDNKNKLTFRMAAHKVLPEEFAYRQKIGFFVPMTEWMETDEWKTAIDNALSDGTLESIAGRHSVELCLNEKGWRKRWRAYALLVWYHHFIG